MEEVLSEDERALRAANPGVRVGTFRSAGVSVGAGQHDGEAVLSRAHVEGLTGVRRGSGGGSLLHLPGDIFWSIVLPVDHPWARRGFVRRFDQLGRGWVGWLQARSVTTRWAPASGADERHCLLSSRGYVLDVGGRALGGASQHVTRTALLHHGVVQATLDPDRLARVLDLPTERTASSLVALDQLGVRVDERDLTSLAEALLQNVAGAPDPPVPPDPPSGS